MSASKSATFKFRFASASARLTDVVDLPTPPLPDATAMICFTLFICHLSEAAGASTRSLTKTTLTSLSGFSCSSSAFNCCAHSAFSSVFSVTINRPPSSFTEAISSGLKYFAAKAWFLLSDIAYFPNVDIIFSILFLYKLYIIFLQ